MKCIFYWSEAQSFFLWQDSLDLSKTWHDHESFEDIIVGTLL